VQNHLPHDLINATNFVLALIVLPTPLELHQITANGLTNVARWGQSSLVLKDYSLSRDGTFSKARLAPEMGPFSFALTDDQSTAASSGCRLNGDRDLSRTGCLAC
jgi:hypothetical protein